MLIPYWFGHWPKKIPWMISILAVLMIFITQFHAHRIRVAERSFTKQTLGISSSISKLRLQVQYKYCSLIYAKNENFCTFVRSKTAELLINESNQVISHQVSSNQVGRQNKKSSVKMNLMWLQYVSMIKKNPQDWPVQLKASSEYGEIVELEGRIKQIATEGFDGVGWLS